MSRTTSSTHNPSGILDLVVIRESGRSARVLMEGMITQTLSRCMHLPEAEVLLKAGLEVIDLPKKYNGRVVTEGETRAVILQRDTTVYVYSMGTAAKDDLEDTNAFVALLMKLIRQLRPRALHCATMGRLVRAPQYAGTLLAVLKKHTELVIVGDTTLKIRTTEGQMMWGILTMTSSAERDFILKRLLAGNVARYLRGEWILPTSTVPMGYMLDADRRIVIDPAAVKRTRLMLRTLANTKLTARQVVNRLGAAGASSPQIRRIHGPDATYADVRNAGAAVKTLTRWVDLYERGRYDVLWPNEFPGLDQIGGMPIERDEPEDIGYLRLAMIAKKPRNGWATADVFQQIRRRRTQPSTKKGGANHRLTKPLLGVFTWSDETYEYKLTGTKAGYELRRRPVSEQGDAWHIEGRVAGEALATISPELLHTSIAHGCARAFGEGLVIELDDQRLWTDDRGNLAPTGVGHIIAATQQRLERAETAAARARRNANLAEDETLAKAFIKDADGHTKEAVAAQKELADLESTQPQQSRLADKFQSNSDLVVRALAGIARLDGLAGRDLRSSLAMIFTDGRLRLTGTGTIEWQISMIIPTERGVAVAGPVNGSVPCTIPQRKRPQSLYGRLVEAGYSELAASIVVAAPRELGDTLLGYGGQSHLEWAALVEKKYKSSELRWRPGQWQLPNTGRQALVDLIVDAGGSVTPKQVKALGGDTRAAQAYSRHRDYLTGRPVIARKGHWAQGPVIEGRDRLYTPVPCPHCGSQATKVILVPEIPSNLLCATCRRPPELGAPVFPDWYLSQ